MEQLRNQVNSFFHTRIKGRLLCQLICLFTSLSPLFHFPRNSGKWSVRQESGENIATHQVHSGIFEMAQQARLLCYSLHHVWFLWHPLCPILTKTWRNDTFHLYQKRIKITLPGQERKLHLQLGKGWHVYYCLSLICGTEDMFTVASPQLCLQVCFCHLLCWHHRSQASPPPPLIPTPSPCHKLLHQAAH